MLLTVFLKSSKSVILLSLFFHYLFCCYSLLQTNRYDINLFELKASDGHLRVFRFVNSYLKGPKGVTKRCWGSVRDVRWGMGSVRDGQCEGWAMVSCFCVSSILCFKLRPGIIMECKCQTKLFTCSSLEPHFNCFMQLSTKFKHA